MFAPPGTKIFASRRLNRKQNKMQRTAMNEALAAGWQRYNSDEDGSDDDFDNNSAVEDLLRIDDTETTELTHSISMNNDGEVEMRVCTTDSFPNPVSLDGEVDDDDSTVESDEGGEDGTALAHEDLHTLLDILHEQSTPTNMIGLYVFDDNEGEKVRKAVVEQSEVAIINPKNTDATKNVVETTDGKISSFLSPPSSSIDSSDDDDDSLSNTDSLDLGVRTTVWPSQKEHPFSTNTNASAKRAIADIVTITNVFSPTHEKQSLSPSYDDNNMDNQADPNYSDDDDDDDEPHQGSEVFLFTEGVRYSGQGTSRSGMGNKLIHIQEAASISFSTDETKHDEDEEINQDEEGKRKDLRVIINDDITSPKSGENCFGSIQLVSPKFFSTDEKPIVPKEVQTKSVMSPLSSMVHPMNLALFDSKDIDRSIKRREDKKLFGNDNVGSPNRVDRVPTSILTSIEQDYALTDNDNRRSNLSTSFKSSTKANRIAYHISDGKRSMSKTERVYSKSFLPKEQIQNPTRSGSFIESSSLTRSSPKASNRGSLAVLLADVRSKIFEVVAIDIQQDTSVGDVLSKVRTSATDPALSDQKYISFCYGAQEFGAPMLPVNLVIDWDKHKTRPLVVAVPVGSTANEMQSVKRVLWKNPKLRDWWKQDDPFVPKIKKETTDPIEETKPMESICTSTLQPAPVVETKTVASNMVTPSISTSLKAYERLEV